MDDYREYLRSIPKVDEVMKIKKLADLAEKGSRTEAVETVRRLTEKLRREILVQLRPGETPASRYP